MAGLGRAVLHGARPTQLSKVYEDLSARHANDDREVTDLFGALAAGLLLVSGLTSAFLLRGVREPYASSGVRGCSGRIAVATPAGAANECDGLQICVSFRAMGGVPRDRILATASRIPA